MKKRIIIVASVFIAIFALASAYLPGILNSSAKKVEAQTTTGTSAMSGFLWSSNIGWIKLNPGTAKDVTMTDADGSFSGFAWSSNIGWINFAPTDIPSTFDQPHVVQLTGEDVRGWARACSVLASSDCTGTDLKDSLVTGGWDGWIKMVNVTLKEPATPTDPPTKVFAGYAWGDLNVGWVDFSLATTAGTPVCTGCCGPCGGVNLNAQCYASHESYTAGDTVTWTLTRPTTGSSPYKYAWTDNDQLGSSKPSPLSDNYPATGDFTFSTTYSPAVSTTYSPTVTVTDNVSSPAQTVTCTKAIGVPGGITVNPPAGLNCENNALDGGEECDVVGSGYSFSAGARSCLASETRSCKPKADPNPCTVKCTVTPTCIITLGSGGDSGAIEFNDDRTFPKDADISAKVTLEDSTGSNCLPLGTLTFSLAGSKGPSGNSWSDATGGGTMICSDLRGASVGCDSIPRDGGFLSIRYGATSTKCPTVDTCQSPFDIELVANWEGILPKQVTANYPGFIGYAHTFGN